MVRKIDPIPATPLEAMKTTSAADFYKTKLTRIKSEDQYRGSAHLEKQAGRLPIDTHYRDDGSQVDATVWCSNDYFGMGQSAIVIDATREATTRGISPGPAPIISCWRRGCLRRPILTLTNLSPSRASIPWAVSEVPAKSTL